MPEDSTTHVYDVVVIGGGLSGLTAAYQLTRKAPDLDLLVLEARDRVGGRTYSVNMKCQEGEDTYDLGGQWIADNQSHVLTLTSDLGLTLRRRYSRGLKAMQLGSELVYHTSKHVPLRGIPVINDFSRLVDKVTSESALVSIENPERSSNLDQFDAMTMEEFRDNCTWLKDSSVPLDSLLSSLFGCSASQVSAQFFLYYCKAAGGLLTAAGGPAMYVQGGAQKMSEEMRKRVGHEKVVTSAPVISVRQEEEQITICTTHAQYRCRHLIVSCPPNQIARIKFEPKLAPVKRLLADRLVPGRIIKVIITYSRAFWRERGLSGCLVAAGDDQPLSLVFDSSTTDESRQENPALVGFIGGDRAVYWAGVEESERRDAVISHLERAFGGGSHDCGQFLDYRELDWSAEAYTGGGPTYPPSTGVLRYYKHLRQSQGSIHFAGTETATVCCGFMEGAVQAGVRAAKQVLYELRPEAALRHDTPLDHVRIDHDRVIKPSANHWTAFITWFGLGMLLVSGVAWYKIRTR